jgi:hypothetical protein
MDGMDGRLMDLSFELSMKLTEREVNFLRLAVSRAASAAEAQEAARLFFKSLRARGSRYTVRDLYGLGAAQ